MSVVKSKRGEGQLLVITKANELAAYSIKICSNETNFPKRYRWCITNKIVDAAMEISNSVKETVCSFENLYKAMRICKRNVCWKDSVAGYVKNGLSNIAKLADEHKNGTYEISKYSVFKVYEPKERDIVSTRIKDRVFQRSLCDNYLTEAISKSFIYDNCACRVNKGTDFARERLKCHLQKFYRKHGRDGYVLKCDLKNYFGSTSHKVAYEAVRKRVSDEWVLQEVWRIISSFNQGEDPDVGMGLGSQATQLIQLAVLDDLDHFIKEQLKVKHYVRYMDDFILIHEDKEYLKFCKAKIAEKIEELERLKDYNSNLIDGNTALSNEVLVSKAKAEVEAYEEFAEKLKEEWFCNGYDSPDVDFDNFIVNLLKEMVGEKE